MGRNGDESEKNVYMGQFAIVVMISIPWDSEEKDAPSRSGR